MTERQSGLRFDIYERVHLADNTVGVRELDEVELVPHIQVYTEGEEAFLKGNLYLTGSYTGETGEGSRTLEYLIPVEITLPLNRIQDVSAVSVDIDNFDVDLLSARSLNVTGVLTLHGIEMLSVPDESWQEETVFVSRAGQFGDISPVTSAANAAPVQENAPVLTYRPEEAGSPAVVPAEKAPAANRKKAPAEPEEVTEVFVNADEENEFWGIPAPVAEEPETEAKETLAPSVEDETVAEAEEEKKELKIAFGSKPPQQDAPYHLKSLIHKGAARSQGSAATPLPEEAAAETPRTDALEWKRLFARGDAEEQKFSRVRVCIVQKEETLDSIARRYNIKPQEILLYNRVSEQDLGEGKVLIIPK